MGHAFTFHFSRSIHGIPRIIAIVDLNAVCNLCGYEEIQRFYKGVAFHSLTLPRFRRLVEEAPQMLDYTCSNCGKEVAPEMTRRGAVIYGFADDAGIIRAYIDCDDGDVVDVTYSVSGDETLDVQALPLWEPKEEGGVSDAVEALTDEIIFERCGRVFNLKQVWRSLLSEATSARGEAPGALVETVGRGCWLSAGESRALIEELVDQLGDDQLQRARDEENLVRLPIATPPRTLPGLPGTRRMPGWIGEWLEEEWLEALEEEALYAEVWMDAEVALSAFIGALEAAKLTVKTEGAGEALRVTDIITPRDSKYPESIELKDILARAAHTGITPGEAGRFTAEEIIADLMGLEL